MGKKKMLPICLLLLFLLAGYLHADTIPIPPAGWSVVAVSSDNTNHPAAHAFDGDTTTWWALYNAAGYSLPGEIIIDLGEDHDVAGFSYLPNLKSPSTRADSFAVFVSDDPGKWEEAAFSGIFDWLDEEDVARRTFFFGPVKGRYVKVLYVTNVSQTSENVHTCDLRLYESTEPPDRYRHNQQISFPHIPEQYTRDRRLVVHPRSSEGLPVTLERLEGPVSLHGDTVLFGNLGGLVRLRARVEGNDTLYPQTVVRTFRLIDLALFYPRIFSPLLETEPVCMPLLMEYPLWFHASIEHPDQLRISSFEVTVDGDPVPVTSEGAVAVARWAPVNYGAHTVHVTAGASNGNATARDYVVTVTPDAPSRQVRGLDHVLINFPSPGRVHSDTLRLPQFVGGYAHLTGHLTITCPAIEGGCDDWDRTARLEVMDPAGNWIEIVRYITPYGVACDHTLDLTDYMSLLQGKVPYRLTIDTWGTGGWEVTFDMDYESGVPQYPYGRVYLLWNRSFPFGDPANLQPVPPAEVPLPRQVEALFLDLVTTGHGWGRNNSHNAAEFYHAVNYLDVSGQRLTQDLWQRCDPNPDGCTGQHGTWYYDRAGWCPGSIARLYRYDLSEKKEEDTLHITYTFDPRYVDQCHPHNPDCISGTTCPDCKDGFNPIFTVSANVVVFSHQFVTHIPEGPEPFRESASLPLEVWPNPVSDYLHFLCEEPLEDIFLYLLDEKGRILAQYHFGDNVSLSSFLLDMSQRPSGVWFIGIISGGRSALRKIVVKR